jgi:two-component system sensor histidine kinase CpxA
MKSLFLRLLTFMWLAMTLLVGAFALIHAWAFPPEAGEARQRFTARAAEIRGENAVYCLQLRLEHCEQVLARREPRDLKLALYRDGELALGEPISAGADLVRAAQAAPDHDAFQVGESELTAVVLDRDPRYVVVAEGPVWSRWMFFLVPDTLPYRLLAIVVVTGLVSVLLARYLSRPIAQLRQATQRIASGDLSVRVGSQLAHADSETRGLGRDLDAMAERITALIESERRLRRDMSHELRSPLTRLNIALELIRRRSPEELAPHFERIERDTARLDALIGELLKLQHLEAETSVHGEALDLVGLTTRIVEDANLEAEQRGCRVRARLQAGVAVRGNRELLRRAIENVIRNAVRFTAEGTEVDVTLQPHARQAVLTVRDHGPGVPEEALQHIFKPFYRVGGDRARSTGGTGLGLAITERAVQLHGGNVRAQNHPERGLLVTIELPLEDGAERDRERSTSPGLSRERAFT